MGDFFPSLAIAGFLCVNLVMMDREYAGEFEGFCRANPRACPLLGVLPAGRGGSRRISRLGGILDLRTDLVLV